MNTKGFYSAVMGLVAVVIAGTIFLSSVPSQDTAAAGAVVMGVEDGKFRVTEFLLLADRAVSDALADHLFENAVGAGSCGSSDKALFEAKLESYFTELETETEGACSVDTSLLAVNPFNANLVKAGNLKIVCSALEKPNLTIEKSYSTNFTPGAGPNPGICEINVFDGDGAGGSPEITLVKAI